MRGGDGVFDRRGEMVHAARIENFATQIAEDFSGQCTGMSDDELAKARLRGAKSVDALIAEIQKNTAPNSEKRKACDDFVAHIVAGRSESESFTTLTSCVISDEIPDDERKLIAVRVSEKLKHLGVRSIYAGMRGGTLWFIATFQPH